MTMIYISTDSNEIRGILEPVKLGEEEFLRDYFFTQDRIKINGFLQHSVIMNIPIGDGKIIQNALKLRFNPMSMISGDLTENETKNLVKKLKKENGLKVAVEDNGVVKHYAPNKYDGYQGGGFI